MNRSADEPSKTVPVIAEKEKEKEREEARRGRGEAR
jgi:hypothetical protein